MSEPAKQFNPVEYYTPAQLAYLRQRQNLPGQERIAQILNEWNVLRREFSIAFSQGIEPTDSRVQALAQQTSAIKRELIGDDINFEEIMKKADQELMAIASEEGKLMRYVMKAINLFEEGSSSV